MSAKRTMEKYGKRNAGRFLKRSEKYDRVLLLGWLAPADVFRCSLADKTLASPGLFSTT
jgi:hypothetical protein